MPVNEQLREARRFIVHIDVCPLPVFSDRELKGRCAVQAVVNGVVDVKVSVVSATFELNAALEQIDGTRNQNDVYAELDIATCLRDFSANRFNEAYEIECPESSVSLVFMAAFVTASKVVRVE